jgi:hypothetical protein
MNALPPQPPRTRDTRKRDRWIIAILATLLTALVIGLATVPVPKTTTFGFGVTAGGSVSMTFSYSSSQSLCPTGAKATVSYTSGTSRSLNFTIIAPNGTTFWNQMAARGSTTFAVPTCGTYVFVMSGSGDGYIDFQGILSYSAPIL